MPTGRKRLKMAEKQSKEKQSKEMQAKESKAVQSEETKELLVKVARESFGVNDDGKPLYSYHINATLRGKPKEISLVPKDNGAYDLLNIIYLEDNEVDGLIIENEFKTEDGDVVKSLIVEVFVVDEGVRYSCQLKTQRDSDKATLNTLVQVLKVKQSIK